MSFTIRWSIVVAAVLLTGPALFAQQPQRKPRHIFVLHDGFHTILSYRDPAWATKDLRAFLMSHKVPENDIIMMDVPFQTATLMDPFPKAGFEYFLGCFDPNSKYAHQSYTKLDQALKAHDVRQGDVLTWIGHSAGGQVGLMMAHLGGYLERYPDLARTTSPYLFDMVVTMGSPLNRTADQIPPSVKRRYYYSPADRVVHLAWVCGSLGLSLLGYKECPVDFAPVPGPLTAECMVRVFYDIEHPAWTKDHHILRRILLEYRDFHPPWRDGAVSPGLGVSLAGLMSRALEDHAQLSLEDPFDD